MGRLPRDGVARSLALIAGLAAWDAVARPAIVASGNVPAFRAAVEGARADLPGAVEFDLAGSDAETVRRQLDAERPEVIVAVGPGALKVAAQSAHPAPIVFVMVADPDAIVGPGRARAFTGVALQVPAGALLDELHRVQPKACQLWTIYSSTESRALVEGLRAAAAVKGCAVVAAEARDAAEALRALQAPPSTVDAYLMLPDRVVRNAATDRVVLQLAFARRFPVVGVSSGDVRSGALLALQLDPHALGRQAADLALKWIAHPPVAGRVELVPPRGYRRVLNEATAGRLGIALAPEVRRGAEVLGP